MKVMQIDGREYRLPSSLNRFQMEMYVHLINWKWDSLCIKEAGEARGHEYDAILPEAEQGKLHTVYPELKAALKDHCHKYPFREHLYFNHMASSQAANINLFLPILLNAEADHILRRLKPDFKSLASEQLYKGFRIEFWDGGRGVLKDKIAQTGTDVDMAIAYYNHQGDLCLWLIEHKLTESEFTTCGGYRSKGRKERHDCTRSFAQILRDKSLCYYHHKNEYAYWDLTEKHQAFFKGHAAHTRCPFVKGMNQLWRNQLMGLGIESDDQQPYKHVTFSVVKHAGNVHLNKTLNAYRELIGNNPKFSVMTSEQMIRAAETQGNAELDTWAKWYRGLYRPEHHGGKQ